MRTQRRGSMRSDQRWYTVETVVEILIHETPYGQRYAPEIGNLCVGFTSLTLEKLDEEINDMRTCWPFIFPKHMEMNDILELIRKNYPAYEEILALRSSL